MTRIIAFDIETTGFDYGNSDRVLEIGAVEIVNGRITGESFHAYINPEGKIIPPSSYMVHKLSNDFLADKPRFSEVAPRLLEFIGDSMVVAHNGFDFDFPFINHELHKSGNNIIARDKQLDSIVIARNRVFGPKSYTLDALAKWFGVDASARADAHGALIDANILARVYLELESAAPARSIADIMAEQHEAFLKHPKVGADFARRTFAASADEIATHEEFMKGVTG